MSLDVANSLFSDLTLANAWISVKPLLFFVLGMAIYAIFIFNFYHFIARKDLFDLDLEKYNQTGIQGVERFFSFVLYVVKYILLFPLFLFFWFIILSILLSFLTKSTSVQGILLTSMALVGSVRVTAYYNEELSKDLAKMLPFALLGVFLIDVSYFSAENSLTLIKQMPGMWKTLFHYLVFVIFLEFILRILSWAISPLVRKRERAEKQQMQNESQE